MDKQPIKSVKGRAVHLEGNDIDTDRIIPARFMRCVTFDGLGEKLFYDIRFDKNGQTIGCVLDKPEHRGATILISGANFGCGSSREHAPEAIRRFGFRAVIAGSFAEIFNGNATMLGVPCVSLADKDLRALASAVSAKPDLEVNIDIETLTVSAGTGRWSGTMKPGAQNALLSGSYDTLPILTAAAAKTRARAAQLGYA